MGEVMTVERQALDAEALCALESDELKPLARGGVVGPWARVDDAGLVVAVAAGRKPAAISIGARAARSALMLGLVVKAYSAPSEEGGESVSFSSWPSLREASPDGAHAEALSFAVARTAGEMDRLERAYLANGVTAHGTAEAEAALGFALGYSVADVAAFVLRQRKLGRRG